MNRNYQVKLLKCCLFWFAGLIPTASQGQPTYSDSFVTLGIQGSDVLRVDTELMTPSTLTIGVARVTITNSNRNSPVDRELLVVFYSKNWRASQGFSYSKRVTLREGAKQVLVEIPHVNLGSQAAWDVAVFEDGRELEDTRGYQGNRSPFNWTSHEEQAVSAAGIQGTAENSADVELSLQQLIDVRAAPAANLPGGLGARRVTPAVVRPQRGEIVPISSLSDDWRIYFAYSLWFVSAETLEEVNRGRPEVVEALRQYVAAGGKLVVHRLATAGDLGTVQEFLGNAPVQLPVSQWSELAETPEMVSEVNYMFGGIWLCSQPITDLTSGLLNDQMQRSVRQASVVASSMALDGNWYWRNLITAVGKPPVWAFCAMIAVFGALLGPGLLIFTARLGRRSLMILLVPAIASLAVAAILAYGVFYEGFDSHVRITSVTRLDASGKAGFAWSRQNYFTGLPPREGLVFRLNTFVRPVRPDQMQNYRGLTDPRRNLEGRILLSDEQRWQGWLKARQQQQMLVGHPVEKTVAPVELTPMSANALQVRNKSEQELPLVVIRGKADDYYFCQSLAAEETRTVTAKERADVAADVAQVMVDWRPEAPPELQDGGSLMEFGRRRRSGLQNEYLDVVNIALRENLSDQLNMQACSFATILRSNDLIEVPLEGQQSSGVHVVIGSQPW